MAAHLPGVIAAMTAIPVIGVPVKSSLEGLDALLSIVQMPTGGIPVATVAINGAGNAAILAAQILSISDKELYNRLVEYKEKLKDKVIKANDDLSNIKYEFKV